MLILRPLLLISSSLLLLVQADDMFAGLNGSLDVITTINSWYLNALNDMVASVLPELPLPDISTYTGGSYYQNSCYISNS